jgi:cellulose synthase/poly-beta-1,6-N-acetylglucosamine synthase-like glycosyltransferase
MSLDYKNYEIFVVDAFSTDGSYEILKKYGNKIKLYQLKGWAPVAYNWAFKNINTEYIAFIDSDNVVPKNWLNQIIGGFDYPNVLEAVGFCATPEDSSMLQYLLGKELESRYINFGEYISRAPTMNAVVKTEIAKKLKFDEKLRVGYDTDFSLRLSKFGKIRYVPSAKVYHIHRATLKSFFKQQKDYAKYAMDVYSKHKEKLKGDQISTFDMIAQPPIALLFILFIMLGFINGLFLYIGAIFFLTLLFTYVYRITKIRTSPKLWLMFVPLFFIRTAAWVIGIFESLTNRF